MKIKSRKQITATWMNKKFMKHSCMNKKSQLAIFIIIGIVILLIAISGFIIALNFNKTSKSTMISGKDKIDQDSLNANLQSCLAKSDSVINEILKNGGGLVFNEDPVVFDGIQYRYWCKSSSLNPSAGCINLVFSRPKIEEDMAINVKNSFESCINLSFYESAGYNVEADDSVVTIIIGNLDVQINVQKKIRLSKSGQEISIDHISTILKIPAGRMIDLANDILNEEIATGNFDKDAWMRSNGAEIEIEKHKPYPDTVYHLMRHNLDTDTWTELNFAISGIDTVADVTKDYTPKPSKWCLVGDNCFFNPNAHTCPTSISNNKPATCSNSSVEKYQACGVPGTPACNGCGKYKSGEEWCEYDSTPGMGYDFVGTRHYKKSCINGIIYTEDCRDYREEICVHKGSGVSSDAMCRPNRWKTCMSQTTQSACSDKTNRDCFWFNDYLASSGTFSKAHYPGDTAVSCFPQVPPGFKFWQLSGMESCNIGDEWIDCDGASCPKVWSESSMLSCMRLGDCGKKYTYSGAFGSVSFKTTDLFKQPEYLANLKIPGLPYLGNSFYFDLPPYNYTRENYNSKSFNCTDCSINDMLTRADEYLNYLNGLDADDLMWDYFWDGEVSYHTRHFSVCMPFVLDEDSDNCRQCEDPVKPCTEYKCKSTGSNCNFYVDAEGYGRCADRTLAVDSPEIIGSTLHGSPFNVFSTDTFASTIRGKKIAVEIDPYTTINISFNTTKAAICREGLLPIAFTDLPITFNPRTLQQGETNFSLSHNMVLYVIPGNYVQEMISQIVTFSSYLDLLDPDSIIARIDELEAKAENVVDDAGQDSSQLRTKFNSLRDEYVSKVQPSVDEFYGTYQGYINSLLYNANNRKTTIFFNCMDANGNNNENEFFVSYRIKEDLVSPKIVSAPNDVISTVYEPKLIFTISTDEPAICKMSFIDVPFEDMPYNMTCSNALFSASLEFPCTGEVAKSNDPDYTSPSPSKVIYVRCRDNPFTENLSESNINTISREFEYN